MKLIIPIIILFTILFLSIFIWICQSEKREIIEKKTRIFAAIGTAFILAFIPSIVIGIFLFGIFGSTNIINSLFSLDISTKELIFLTITLTIYFFTLDTFLELSSEVVIGKNSISIIILFLIRILVLYVMGGIIFNLKQDSAFIIALGIAFVILLWEYFKLINDKTNTN